MKKAVFVVLVVGLIGGVVYFFSGEANAPDAAARQAPQVEVQESTEKAPLEVSQSIVDTAVEVAEDLFNPPYPQEVEQLQSMELKESEAVMLVEQLMGIAAYNANQGDMFTGFSNAEVTAQLLGGNARNRAFIGKEHPRVNAKNELVDKWGTPYEFHFLSSRRVEIISAGPDLTHYTSDDVKY